MEELKTRYISEIEKLEQEERELKAKHRREIEKLKTTYENQRDEEIERKVKQKTNEIEKKYKQTSEQQEQKDVNANIKIKELKQSKEILRQELTDLKKKTKEVLEVEKQELDAFVKNGVADYEMYWKAIYLTKKRRKEMNIVNNNVTEENPQKISNEDQETILQLDEERDKARTYYSEYENDIRFSDKSAVMDLLTKNENEINQYIDEHKNEREDFEALVANQRSILQNFANEKYSELYNHSTKEIDKKHSQISKMDSEISKLHPSLWTQSNISDSQYKEILNEIDKIYLNSNGEGRDKDFNELKTNYDKNVKDLNREQNAQLHHIKLKKQDKYYKYRDELAEQWRIENEKMKEENKQRYEKEKEKGEDDMAKFDKKLESEKQERIKKQEEHEKNMRESEERLKALKNSIHETNRDIRNYTFNTSINNQSTLPTTMNNYNNQQQSYIPQQKKYYTTNKSNTSPNISNTSLNMNHRKFIFKVPKSMNSSQQLYNSDSTEASNGIYYSNKTNNQAMYNQQTENQNYNSHQPQMQLRNATQYSNIKNYNTMAQVQKIDNLNYQYGNQNINNNSNMNPNIDVFLSQSNSFNRVYNDHRQQRYKQQTAQQSNFFQTQNIANSSFSFDGRNC